MIIVEFMRDGVGDCIKIAEENSQGQLETLVNDFINGKIDYLHIFRN